MVALTRRRLVAFALALFGATAVTVSSVVPDGLLVVADAETDDRLLEIPVDQGEEVTIAYTHSVERTPVEDVYVVDGAELRADRSVFQSFGAGLPADAERTDEGYVVEGAESHAELFVVPGEIAGHELVVAGERYDLVDASDGRVVLFVTDQFVSDAFERDGSLDAAWTDASSRAESIGGDKRSATSDDEPEHNAPYETQRLIDSNG